jgi:multiple antibiotic resistance protein
MLAGPGAISTAILLHTRAEGPYQLIAFYLVIGVVCLASYIILRIAARTTRWLSPIALNIATRIMGLLLAAVAIQFMLNAALEIKGQWMQP